MRNRILTAFMLAAFTGCSDGSNVIGDRPMTTPEDTGTPVNADGGTTADASPDSNLPPPDAAVTPDVMTTNDQGMNATCHDSMCATQSITSDDGTTRVPRAAMDCPMTPEGRAIDGSPYGVQVLALCNAAMSSCSAETTIRMIVDGATVPVRARFQIQRSMVMDMARMVCTPCGRYTVNAMDDGRVIASGQTCTVAQ